jgi:hypothetical protein
MKRTTPETPNRCIRTIRMPPALHAALREAAAQATQVEGRLVSANEIAVRAIEVALRDGYPRLNAASLRRREPRT